jgi:hypothetical protein
MGDNIIKVDLKEMSWTRGGLIRLRIQILVMPVEDN